MHKEAYSVWVHGNAKYRHTPDVALCSGIARRVDLVGHNLAY